MKKNASKLTEENRYILNFVVASAGYILLGLLLILAPERSQRLICYILGIVALIGGIARIAWYFMKDDFSRAFHNDIPSGVILLIAGIYLIARPDAVWAWLPVLLGFAVVFDSIIKLQQSFDLRRTGFRYWWAVLAAALATAVLGILLILGVMSEGILLLYFGIVLIVDGIVNLATILLLVFRMRKAKKQQAAATGEDEGPAQSGDTPPPTA